MNRTTFLILAALLWPAFGQQTADAQELPTTVKFDEETHFAIAVADSQLMLVEGIEFINARCSIEYRLAVREIKRSSGGTTLAATISDVKHTPIDELMNNQSGQALVDMPELDGVELRIELNTSGKARKLHFTDEILQNNIDMGFLLGEAFGAAYVQSSVKNFLFVSWPDTYVPLGQAWTEDFRDTDSRQNIQTAMGYTAAYTNRGTAGNTPGVVTLNVQYKSPYLFSDIEQDEIALELRHSEDGVIGGGTLLADCSNGQTVKLEAERKTDLNAVINDEDGTTTKAQSTTITTCHIKRLDGKN